MLSLLIMAHTQHAKSKLILRVRRMKGQLEAVERALEKDEDCSTILRTVVSCRGALNGLMAELMDGEIRYHVLDSQSGKAKQMKSADDLIALIHSYLK